MSKDLAQQQTEWDLHENPEKFIPLEFTEEIKPETFGLEITEATQLLGGIDIISAELEVLKNAYIDVINMEITSENLPIFKELRLKLVKNRTSRDKWRKAKKSYFLNGGRFVDAIAKKYDVDNEEMESKLMEAEKYFENLEKEAKRILNEKRIEIIRPYVDDVAGLDFSDFSDENFDDFVLGKKTRYNEKIEAEKQEAIRIENERLAEIERKRLEEIENEKIRVENARLQKEAEAKELELQKERKIQADKDAKFKAENDKLQAELQAKKDAEIKAESERLAKIEADKKAAELAAKAPVKKQLSVWVDSFELPIVGVDNEASKRIKEKFEAFKLWSQTQIKNL